MFLTAYFVSGFREASSWLGAILFGVLMTLADSLIRGLIEMIEVVVIQDIKNLMGCKICIFAAQFLLRLMNITEKDIDALNAVVTVNIEKDDYSAKVKKSFQIIVKLQTYQF